MTFPTYEKWFAALPADQKTRVEQLVSILRSLGDSDAEQRARSEVAENIPQLAGYVFLRRLWPKAIDCWTQQPADWIKRMTQDAARNPDGQFADAGAALSRMISAGVSVADIGAVARYIAYDTTFGLLYHLGPPDDLAAPPGLPHWMLVETTSEGQPTGREVAALHESLLSMDPSGREGRSLKDLER
jgi:hypothetical protein